MSREEKQIVKKVPLEERHQNFEKGYQPTQGNLDSSNPPQGGSGVPSSSSSDTEKNNKKD